MVVFFGTDTQNGTGLKHLIFFILVVITKIF